MTDTEWVEHNMEENIRALLRTVHNNTDPGNPATRPFVTSYQIAMMFERNYRDIFDHIGYPIGGEGTVGSNTLASDIGNKLALRIRNCQVTDIDCEMLSCVPRIVFRGPGREVVSSVDQVTMFRMRE